MMTPPTLEDEMFRVADHDYELTSASLELFSRTREDIICWGVKITAKHQGGSDDMSNWKPAIIADVLVETTPGQMAFWYDIAGTTIEWEEPNPDPQALFEVFGPVAIYNCKCQFAPVPGNAGVQLLFEGMVDVDVDYPRLPIRVNTVLKVAPWPWGKMSEQECRDEFHRLGFRDPVAFQVIKGVSSLVFLDQ